ncbi:hypothetical protein LXL04_001695 [Taraxacum kok-saghyz]
MRILTEGNEIFACALYACIVGMGSFFFGYIPTIFYLLLAKVGISEDVYSPYEEKAEYLKEIKKHYVR